MAAVNRKLWMFFQARMIENGLISTCTNCEFWDSKTNTCMTYESLPPPDVIVAGCEEWELYIPF